MLLKRADDAELLAAIIPYLQRGDAPEGKFPDGRGEYWGLCPFHTDTHATNFSVSERGYRCFACDAKGGLSALAAHFGVNGNGTHAPVTRTRCTIASYSEAKHIPVDFLVGLGLADGRDEHGNPELHIPYRGFAGDTTRVRRRLFLTKRTDGGKDDRFLWGPGKGLTLYGLDRMRDVKTAGWVLLVEGESDCHTAWLLGIPALGVPGAQAWKKEWVTYLDGVDVFAWQESDSAGQGFAQSVVATIPTARVIVAPDGAKDLSEAYIQGRDVVAMLEELKASATGSAVVSCSLADVGAVYAAVSWTWLGHIPRGHITIIAGPQGTGKTYYAAQLIAVLTGAVSDLPDGAPYSGPVGTVILLETESMRGEYLTRLTALGVDVAGRVRLPGDATYTPQLPKDLANVKALATECGAVGIVLDSLSGGHDLDENGAEMRRILRGLAELAAALNIPVIVVHHARKKNALEPVKLSLDRIRGSSTISQFARAVFGLYRLSDDLDGPVRVDCLKSNFVKPFESFGFTIGDDGLTFCDAPTEDKPETATDRAGAFLREQLHQGPRGYTELVELGEAEGITRWALYQAKTRLRIVTKEHKWAWPIATPTNTRNQKDRECTVLAEVPERPQQPERAEQEQGSFSGRCGLSGVWGSWPERNNPDGG